MAGSLCAMQQALYRGLRISEARAGTLCCTVEGAAELVLNSEVSSGWSRLQMECEKCICSMNRRGDCFDRTDGAAIHFYLSFRHHSGNLLSQHDVEIFV